METPEETAQHSTHTVRGPGKRQLDDVGGVWVKVEGQSVTIEVHYCKVAFSVEQALQLRKQLGVCINTILKYRLLPRD